MDQKTAPQPAQPAKPAQAEAPPAPPPQGKTETQIPKLAQDQIYVKIYAPFKNYYEGVAKSVTATNDTGKFDVLAKHHNFITILNPGEIIVRDDQGEHKIENSLAVMHVKTNQVIVFLNV